MPLVYHIFPYANSPYRKYRREIKRLRDEHPLFEVRPDISETDFEGFVSEALMLPAMLQKTDSVSFFVLGELLHQSLQAEDDGSASFLLNAAEELLYIFGGTSSRADLGLLTKSSFEKSSRFLHPNYDVTTGQCSFFITSWVSNL